MSKHLPLIISAALLAPSSTNSITPRAILIEARELAYDANYRNDQEGLRSVIATLQPLAASSEEVAYVNYYLSWTYGALMASQFQASDAKSALDSATLALEHARRGLTGREKDPEFQVALANALIGVMILDRGQFERTFATLRQVRQKALELGPRNPRVILMDAGILFNDPTEAGGRERGIARTQEALRLFEDEANARTIDALAPRWGHASAQATLATFYLRMQPPRPDLARTAAETALRMRPDFWYVREQVLPRLQESGSGNAPSLLDELVGLERAALDRWITGDPQGYLNLYAPEVTYFDPMREQRVDGIAAMKTVVAGMTPENFPVKDPRYDMINPKVQRHGDVALLTFQLVSYGKIAERPEMVLARWNSTEVYRRIEGAWKIIHSHWSFTKPDVKLPGST